MSKLIVGLGNPGPQYAWTRHNLGFLALEALCDQQKISLRNSASNNGMTAKASISGIPCSLLLPTTFMNNSGAAVQKMAQRQGTGAEDILVLCDDLDLPFGKLRLRAAGSAGGHNGLKSIIAQLGTNRFARLRLGIGSPKDGRDPVEYVLENFTPAEKKALPEFINHALDCVTSWVTEGAPSAMNKFNKNKEGKE